MSSSAKTVDFYWDIGSTNTYFAWHLLKPILAKHNAKLNLHAFNLGFVFREHKYTLMEEPKAKLINRKRDLQRWAELHNLPFRMPDRFPIKSSVALRAALVARELDVEHAFLDKIFARYWEQNDPSICGVDGLVEVAQELGLDAQRFAERMEADDIRSELIQSTQTALQRGVFGAPSFFVGDELYWGKDRMEFIDAQLASL